MNERKIDVTLRLSDDGVVEVSFLDLESGLNEKIESVFSPDEHPEFNELVGNELYSWLTLMAAFSYSE